MSYVMGRTPVRLHKIMSGVRLRKLLFGVSCLIIVCTCAISPYRFAEAEEAESNFRFEDDFIGKTLRPEWEIQNEDPDRWTLLEDDYILLISTSGISNVFQLKHDILQNFEIEARVGGDFENGQCFYLRLDQDKENHVVITACGMSGHGLINFEKNQGGSETSFSELISGGAPAYGLKLLRSGPEITGYYSKGGEGGWKEIGSHYFIKFDGKLSLAAWNENPSAPEGGFRLDYVKVNELE